MPQASWFDLLCKAAAEHSWWENVSLSVLGGSLLMLLGWLGNWLYRRIRGNPTTEEWLYQIDRHLNEQDGILGRLALHPDEMRPPPVEPGRDLSEHERRVVTQAIKALRETSDLISEEQLGDAQRRVAAQERAVTATYERLRGEASDATRQGVAVLLAHAGIQLGTIAMERRQYSNAAEIYQRAVAWAQQGDKEETLRLALYQTGLALLSGCVFGPAKDFFERARQHEAALGRPDTLHHLALCLNELGDRAGALAAYNAAVEAYHQLAQTEAEARRADLATTLSNQGALLRVMEQPEAALAALDEALALRRELAALDHEAFDSKLVSTLNNHGNVLCDMGCPQQALTDYKEALMLCRRLADKDAGRAHASLAMTLNNLGAVLRTIGGQEADALSAFDEALRLYRQLAEVEPEAFQHRVADALNNVGAMLASMGRFQEGEAAIDEALAIYDKLGRTDPDGFRPHLSLLIENRKRLQVASHTFELFMKALEHGTKTGSLEGEREGSVAPTSGSALDDHSANIDTDEQTCGY